jgi:hypothetical protein
MLIQLLKVKASRNRPEGPEGGGGIALLFLDLGARRGGWSAPRPGRFIPGKDPVLSVKKAGWSPGPVWTCAKNLAPTGIRSPDRPARSQSLCRLSYPDPIQLLPGRNSFNLQHRQHGCPRQGQSIISDGVQTSRPSSVGHKQTEMYVI